MLTITTPVPARVAPSWCGLLAAPCRYLPPWIHTITGSPAAPRSGDQTLSVNQSVEPSPVPSETDDTGDPACGTDGPKSSAPRTPSHGCAGVGAANRRKPTG